MKKKIKLRFNKETITKLSTNESKNLKGGDPDTPTINDDCDTTGVGCYNTWIICDLKDWCGYNHETDCIGPLITSVN